MLDGIGQGGTLARRGFGGTVIAPGLAHEVARPAKADGQPAGLRAPREDGAA